MKERTQNFVNSFFERHPDLICIREPIMKAAALWTEVLGSGGKILLCGNGGSCADCDHIAGELLKGFLLKRPVSTDFREKLAQYGDFGTEIGSKLQHGLPAISLCSHSAPISAFANDVDGDLVFAQQVFAYGNPGDILVGISTSGNSKNVSAAMMVACGLVLAGLSIFFFFGCKSVTKGLMWLTQKMILLVKKLFLRKEKEA